MVMSRRIPNSGHGPGGTFSMSRWWPVEEQEEKDILPGCMTTELTMSTDNDEDERKQRGDDGGSGEGRNCRKT